MSRLTFAVPSKRVTLAGGKEIQLYRILTEIEIQYIRNGLTPSLDTYVWGDELGWLSISILPNPLYR